MRSVHTYFLLSYCFIVQFIAITITSAQEDDTLGEKRVMRNVLVRYDRSGIRNALVRFGKRMPDMYFLDAESRRGTGLKPSVPSFIGNSFKIVLIALFIYNTSIKTNSFHRNSGRGVSD